MILDRSREVAKEQIQAAVKERYFPELWYMLGNWFQAATARDKSVLEVGFGIGLVAQALARSGWRVTLVDPAAAALGVLRQRFDAAGLDGALELGELEQLPYASGSFPYVVSVNTLEFARRPEAFLAEIARVLPAGGKAVIATFNKLGPWGLPAVARAIRVDDGKRRARFVSKGDFERLLRGAGLKIDNIYERAAYLPITPPVLGALKLPLAGAFVALVGKEKGRKGRT